VPPPLWTLEQILRVAKDLLGLDEVRVDAQQGLAVCLALLCRHRQEQQAQLAAMPQDLATPRQALWTVAGTRGRGGAGGLHPDLHENAAQLLGQ